MKNKIKSTFIAASLIIGASHISHAALLVGWHDFDGSATEAPDQNGSGYSGLLSKNGTSSSSTTGGSNDGIYGNSDVVPGTPGSTLVVPNAPASDNDGYAAVRSDTPAGITFSLMNDTNGLTDLKWLYFDALTSTAGVTSLAVQYQIGAGPVNSLPTVTVAPLAGIGGLSEDYTDFGFDLTGLFLPNGQTVNFFLTTNGIVRIDNVAITGIVTIPEPSSVLAIGCLLSSGLLLRNRKTRQSKA